MAKGWATASVGPVLRSTSSPKDAGEIAAALPSASARIGVRLENDRSQLLGNNSVKLGSAVACGLERGETTLTIITAGRIDCLR
jgi:hypothetical protein